MTAFVWILHIVASRGIIVKNYRGDIVDKLVQTTTNINIGGMSCRAYFQRPAICPRCHNAIAENILNASRFFDTTDTPRLSVLYQCNNCFMPFISIYVEIENSSSSRRYELIDVGPRNIKRHVFDESILSISPRFAEIYNQAYEAEQRNLAEVCGLAYGKALEFLVKDYAISKNESEQDSIANMPLAKCIEKYIEHPKVKTLATRCAWLRNDQAHYVVKHEALSLDDLKNLLNAVQYWIQADLAADFAASIEPIRQK